MNSLRSYTALRRQQRRFYSRCQVTRDWPVMFTGAWWYERRLVVAIAYCRQRVAGIERSPEWQAIREDRARHR
jgi:hypothetical protein